MMRETTNVSWREAAAFTVLLIAMCALALIAFQHGSSVAQHERTNEQRQFDHCVRTYGWGSPRLAPCMKGGK